MSERVNIEQVREALGACVDIWDGHMSQDDSYPFVISGTMVGKYKVAKCTRDEDAHLIANAPTWLRQMADEIEALRAELRIQEDLNVTLQKENDILRARISEIGELDVSGD